MKTETMAMQTFTAARRGGKYSVRLASVGNPDYGQDPNKPMYGVPRMDAHVQTLIEARQLCEAYISYFDLGGGNWFGGEVIEVATGLVIGRFSYNGRLWADKLGGREIEL